MAACKTLDMGLDSPGFAKRLLVTYGQQFSTSISRKIVNGYKIICATEDCCNVMETFTFEIGNRRYAIIIIPNYTKLERNW